MISFLVSLLCNTFLSFSLEWALFVFWWIVDTIFFFEIYWPLVEQNTIQYFLRLLKIYYQIFMNFFKHFFWLYLMQVFSLDATIFLRIFEKKSPENMKKPTSKAQNWPSFFQYCQPVQIVIQPAQILISVP